MRSFARFIPAFIGLVVGVVLLGARIDPTDLRFLGTDQLNGYVGWTYFRDAPLAFPLGSIDAYFAPFGASVLLTDSNWLASILLRPFASLLPHPFQFVGLWLLLCHVLNAHFGARLVGRFTDDVVVRAAAAILFALSPVVMIRLFHPSLGHPNLVAMFLVLWAIHLAHDTEPRLGPWLACSALATAVHPYLAAMVVPFALVSTLRGPRRIHSVVIALTVAAIALTSGAVGGSSNAGAAGFGDLGTDLATFFRPRGTSAHIFVDATRGTAEGYGYLGAGLVLLLIVGAWCARRPPRPRIALSVMIIAILQFAFAMLPKLSVGDVVLIDGTRALAFLEPITSMLRANGRFLLPLWVVIVTFACASAASISRVWLRRTIFIAATCIQLIDIGPYVLHRARIVPGSAELTSPDWSALLSGRTAMVPLPPAYMSSDCNGELPLKKLLGLALLAANDGMTFHGGYLARVPVDAVNAHCARVIESRDWRADTVYVFPNRAEPYMSVARGLDCRAIDEVWACVVPQ